MEARLVPLGLTRRRTRRPVFGSMALKFESRLMRVVDRRKVAYSCKTVGGLDRRTYQLETTVEFFSHGVATFPVSADVLKRLNLGPQ